MQSIELEQLIKLVAKLPGIGQRSARRMVLHMLKNKEQLMHPLARSLENTAAAIVDCERCGNIDTHSPCSICTGDKRDRAQVCVVEDVADLWALERGGVFSGLYHVLGGTLSALDGRGPDQLRIQSLLDRVAEGGIKEVIIATNATVDGQTTAYYITEKLQDYEVSITRIAHGVPVGGELDYLDEGTLSTAFAARKAC